MQLYFYADEESLELLVSPQPKALLVGGDFGYGNFGDVLQHIGSVRHVKTWTGLATVSVFALDAISRHLDPTALRKSYAVEALLFVAEVPIATEDADRLGLGLVTAIDNTSFVHLYGGGYLNELWGDFVLKVVEHFLEKLPGVPYVMSGQQLSSGYVQQTREHVETYSPRLVGMRDKASLERAQGAGLRAEFSFDDAVEPLLDLGTRLELREGDGAFVHLNTSSYTSNDEGLSEMLTHLEEVASILDGKGRVVLLQAFQDAREEVVDSLETVKRMEAAFPFFDIETELLVRAILGAETGAPRVLQGRFGYSSSYHVTLWLQLNGIPCWLRGSNDYYAQKRAALGIEGRFSDFLKLGERPDHSANLRDRERWLSSLRKILEGITPTTNRIEWTAFDSGTSTRAFQFKGEPRLEAKLDESWAAVLGLREENERLNMQVSGMQDAMRLAEEAADERGASQARLATQYIVDKWVAEHSTISAQLLEATGVVASLKATVAHMKAAETEFTNRFAQVEAESESLRRELAAAAKREALCFQRIAEFSAQITAIGSECRALERSAREAEAHWQAARRDNDRLGIELNEALVGKGLAEQRLAVVESRLAACNEQLTAVGGQARQYRESAELSRAALMELGERESGAFLRVEEVMRSRSWRWTRPARVVFRYFHTGRFDPAGNVGLFEIMRMVGRKAPVPPSWRSHLGRALQKLRRQ